MKQHKRKFLVLLMSFCMVFTMMPSVAFATEQTAPAEEQTVEAPEAQEEAAPAEDVAAPETPEAGEDQATEGTVPEDAQAEQEPGDAELPAEDIEEDVPVDDNAEIVEFEDAPEDVQKMVLKAAADYRQETGDKVSYTSSGKPVTFTVKANGKTFKGGCANLGISSKSSGKGTVTSVGRKTKIARMIYYFGYTKKWYTMYI